jgi:undecaprenyl-diphosphatase
VTLRSAAALISATAATAFLLLTVAVLRHAGPLFRIDAAISDAARRFALEHPAWRSALYALTVTGSTAVLGPLAAVACLLLLRCRRWGAACLVAVAMPVTLLIRLLLVNLIARPRPIDRLAPSAGWSFPSGHSTAAATAAVLAIIVCWPMLRHRWSRILLIAGAGGWAALVGWSRVGLVVHWPSDVLGAWLLVLAVVPAIALPPLFSRRSWG